MQTILKLFTRKYTAEMSLTEDGGIQLNLAPEEVENLIEYLQVVLPEYMPLPEGELTSEQLIRFANQWQMANPEEELSEPITKLPYDVELEYSVKLQELSKIKGISQAQLLTLMINKAYDREVKGKS